MPRFLVYCALAIGCSTSPIESAPSPDAAITDSEATDSQTPDDRPGTDAVADTPAKPGDGSSCDAPLDVTKAVESSLTFARGGPPVSDPASCAAGTASKTYLRFSATPGNYRIDLKASGPSASEAAVYTRLKCSDTSSELTCNARGAFLNSYVGVHSTTDVFIVLDGAWFQGGFTVGIRKLTSCPTIPCSSFGGQPDCYSDGICAKSLACGTTKGDCDKNPDNGCETDTSASTANCGGCGKVCGGMHAKGTCSAGACKLVCDVGFRDCNDKPDDGCESDPLTDTANCGKCGTACAGGGCNAGACTPAPTTLDSTFLASARFLLADSTYVYMRTGDDAKYSAKKDHVRSILRFPIGGGAPTVFATNVGVNGGSPGDKRGGFAQSSTKLFWTETTAKGLYALPKAGGPATKLTDLELTGEESIVADETNVYWKGGTGLYAMPIAGGTPRRMSYTEGLGVTVTVQGSYLYLTDYKYRLQRIATTASTIAPTPIATGTELYNLFHATGTSAHFLASDKNLLTVPLDGGTIASLGGPFPNKVVSIIAYSGNAYFSVEDPFASSSDVVMATDGSKVWTIAEKQSRPVLAASPKGLFFASNWDLKSLPL